MDRSYISKAGITEAEDYIRAACRSNDQGARSRAASAAAVILSTAANGGDLKPFINALRDEHPTLLGQIAKAVGIAVTQRCLYSPDWRPYDPIAVEGQVCQRQVYSVNVGEHAEHDGRIDCATFYGASLMARQSYI